MIGHQFYLAKEEKLNLNGWSDIAMSLAYHRSRQQSGPHSWKWYTFTREIFEGRNHLLFKWVGGCYLCQGLCNVGIESCLA